MIVNVLHRYTLMAALALGVFPVVVPAGEAPATSAAPQSDADRRNAEQKLAEAQLQLEAAARRVAELSSQMGRRFNFQLANGAGDGPPPRALLGINVDRASGREGARVMDVSPGGAAAQAGIKPGDIITGIADLDLTKDSEPSRALVEKMNQLQPDQKVKVAVLRDGRKLSFDVTPRPAPPDVIVRREGVRGGGPGSEGVIIQRGTAPGGQGPGVTREFRLQAQPGRGGPDGGPAGQPGSRGVGPDTRRAVDDILARTRDSWARELERSQVAPGLFGGGENDTRFGGAELASLSERLGSYFGVKSGVLVVRAGVDSQFKLQDGDVLMAIDGREITSAQQAGRILRSYQPGEKLTLKVQRDRKVQNLEITAPGAGPGTPRGGRK
jgi:membrane-associated protease RseP (regulator of RpoE activity)